MDPTEEESLEAAFEDDPTPRREGDEDDEGEGGEFVRRQWKANAGCGCV